MTTMSFFLIQLAVLAYAMVGGVFLAFSDFIMRSLARTGGHGGVEAMQVINREVFRWIFMALLLGMAAGSLGIIVFGALALPGPGSMLILLSGLVYLIGCFGVTMFCNVPLNNALAGMKTATQTTHDYWLETYVPRWTFWNSVRTAACAVSAALLLLGFALMINTTP